MKSTTRAKDQETEIASYRATAVAYKTEAKARATCVHNAERILSKARFGNRAKAIREARNALYALPQDVR